MENPAFHDGYEEVRRNAKSLYSKIGRVWCPKLNDWVVFNNVGFYHLIWKGRRRRSEREQKRRFLLLGHAADIVGDSNAIVFREGKLIANSNEHDQMTAESPNTTFWRLVAKRQGETITVVVCQAMHGKKHFLSIFNKNKNRSRKSDL